MCGSTHCQDAKEKEKSNGKSLVFRPSRLALRFGSLVTSLESVFWLKHNSGLDASRPRIALIQCLEFQFNIGLLSVNQRAELRIIDQGGQYLGITQGELIGQ